jgi:hypothetical protein
MFVGFDIGAHVLRRHQPNIMAEPPSLARPVMPAAAGLDADQTGFQLREKAAHIRPTQPSSQHHFSDCIDTVNLKTCVARSRPMIIAMADGFPLE